MKNIDKAKKELLDLMKIHYGFSSFLPGQEQAIEHILRKNNTLVIMPTGGGKSLCYQLPALILPGVTIVISPLIALMKDQVDQLNKRGINATFINSSISPSEAKQRLRAVQQGKYKLLYIAPERFYNQEFISLLQTIPVGLFAIDEAHCISQWGHDFRPSYMRLKQIIKLVNNPPVVALTATATPEVRQDIKKQLELINPAEIITGFARKNLQFGVSIASPSQKQEIILQTILNMPEPIGIIYASTRAKTESILQMLIDQGIDAVAYHAGMDQTERKRVQNDFMSGKTPIIVATNAFGMGIDKANIRFVIHADLPGTLENYYQEAGRAGRDGKNSLCLLLYSPRDRYLREFFIKGDNPSPELIFKVYNFLISYDENTILLTYAEIAEQISEDVPEMAIGNAIKILEEAGYCKRSAEKIKNAYLKISAWDEIKQTISTRAKIQTEIFTKLQELYKEKLNTGWEINLQNLAEMINFPKSSLLRFIKKMKEKGLLEYYPPFRGTEITILKRVEKKDFKIDFTRLTEKLNAAYDKLDKMEKYVYHKQCRQKYILDYFGDLNSQSCGKCDLCLYGYKYPQKKERINYPKKYKTKDREYTEKIKPVNKNILSTKLTQLETFELYQQGYGLEEIAQKRNLATNIIVNHLCYLIEKKLPININDFVSETKQKKIIRVNNKLKTTKLKEIKEKLGPEFSYTEIKLTLAKK